MSAPALAGERPTSNHEGRRTGRWEPLARSLLLVGLVSGCDLLSSGAPEPSSVTITPGSVSFDAIGDTASLAAEVRDADGQPMPEASVDWSSSSASVARVSATGLVTSAGSGTVRITATAGAATATANVSVVQAATELERVSGEGQSGPAGQPLPQPLVVRAYDRLHQPAGGVLVSFEVEEGGGTTSVAEVRTDPDGTASTTWTLGPTAGDEQRVRSFLSFQVGVGVSFAATAVAGPPARIRIVSGNGQAAPRLLTLNEPLVVRVVDRFENPWQGVQVAFDAVEGGGTVNPTTATTDAAGLASTEWTLGETLGEQSVSVTVAGLAPTLFSATASELPARIEISGGDGQVGRVGERLTNPPAVRILDAPGAPVSGVDVRFSIQSGDGSLERAGAQGTFPAVTARSDASGIATTGGWILGAAPGTQTVTAEVPGFAPLIFSATAQVGPPTRLNKLAGDGQVGSPATLLSAPLVVRVSDALGNPVPGAAVTFSPATGSGSVAPGATTTDAAGSATARWTLGPGLGLQSVTVSIPAGASVSFQARATAGDATGLTIEAHFVDELTASQHLALVTAMGRWRLLIPGRLESTFVSLPAGGCGSTSPAISRTVDDVLVFISVRPMDGVGGNLARAGPCVMRQNGLPAVGQLSVDEDDLQALEARDQLENLLLHELAHVLGFGSSIWRTKGLLRNPSLPSSRGADTHFSGAAAIAAFDQVGGDQYFSGDKVPVENREGGSGTQDSHWRQSVFVNELMTGFLLPGANPLSRVTIASLGDLGYEVDQAGADQFLIRLTPLAAVAGDLTAVGDDLYRGPIYVVDRRGRILDVVFR